MSLTPIFDEVLADSDPDIFLASNIFPNPVVRAIETLQEALTRIGHPQFAKPIKFFPETDFRDWSYIYGYHRHIVTYPANKTNHLITFNGSVA